MAKNKTREPAPVLVSVTAGFKYDGVYRRVGDSFEMRAGDVADYKALNMIRVLDPVG